MTGNLCATSEIRCNDSVVLMPHDSGAGIAQTEGVGENKNQVTTRNSWFLALNWVLSLNFSQILLKIG
jgi:hypothetical protein